MLGYNGGASDSGSVRYLSNLSVVVWLVEGVGNWEAHENSEYLPHLRNCVGSFLRFGNNLRPEYEGKVSESECERNVKRGSDTVQCLDSLLLWGQPPREGRQTAEQCSCDCDGV